jgi:hypothetical protein
MQRTMRSTWLTGFLLLSSLLGCGKDDGGGSNADGKLGAANYVVLESGDLQRGSDKLSGSGAVAFKEPVGEIGAKKSYTLTFSLQDGGSLVLLAQGAKSLENSVELKFSRAAGELKATLSAAGKNAEPKLLAGVDAASDSVTLTIDIHNDESPAHVLVWSGNDFAEEKALLNSEEDTPGQGSGTFWGLRLVKATVTSALIGDPKYVEEE